MSNKIESAIEQLCKFESEWYFYKYLEEYFERFIQHMEDKMSNLFFNTTVTLKCLDDNGLVELGRMKPGTVFINHIRGNLTLFMVLVGEFTNSRNGNVTCINLQDGSEYVYEDTQVFKPVKSIHINYHTE